MQPRHKDDYDVISYLETISCLNINWWFEGLKVIKILKEISRIANRFQLKSVLQNINLSHDRTCMTRAQSPLRSRSFNSPAVFYFARALDDNITKNRRSVNRLHQKTCRIK